MVEVKGGSVSLDRGEWRQVGDGFDGVIHPVDQAVACKYLLCDYLDDHPRWSAGRPRTAHLVALLATTLPDDFIAPGLARWMALDKTDVPHAAARIKAALQKVRDEPEAPTAQDVADLVDCLAGTGARCSCRPCFGATLDLPSARIEKVRGVAASGSGAHCRAACLQPHDSPQKGQEAVEQIGGFLLGDPVS